MLPVPALVAAMEPRVPRIDSMVPALVMLSEPGVVPADVGFRRCCDGVWNGSPHSLQKRLVSGLGV